MPSCRLALPRRLSRVKGLVVAALCALVARAALAEAPPADTASVAPAPQPPAEAPVKTWPSSTVLGLKTPAVRFANLAPWQCRTELTQKKLPVKRTGGATKGIATPVRVAGSFGAVTFVTPGKRSVYGLFDCRLSLSLSELARVLERHGVVEVYVDNMYRPRAHLPGKRHKRSQHAYGLAIDILGFKFADGRKLLVEDEWAPAPGEAPCTGDTGPIAPDGERTLRAIVCDVASAEIFHHMLTPNYDRAHANHFHFDIQRGEKSQIVR